VRLGRAIALTVAGLTTTACAYQNTIYNAERLYERAERSRRAGEDSSAVALYREVVDKTAAAYRARPESDWSAEALFLLGRSRLRMGENGAAEAAFARAEGRAAAELRPPIRVYRAVTLADAGRDEEALRVVAEVLAGPLDAESTAEARLLAGRTYLARGQQERGWWELDRAVEADGHVRVEAGLERLRWAVAAEDSVLARRSLELLFSYPEAGARRREVAALVRGAADRWGAVRAAGLADAAVGSRWEREARGLLRLDRARLLREGGRSEEAEAEAWAVAGGLGGAAAEARVLLASWSFAESEDIVDAYETRAVLLPAESHPEAAALLEAIDELELFTDRGLEEPLGWFAAAEIARDALGAEYVARGLFLAYADAASGEPWAPKALLAALEVSPNPDDREWLVGRLEAHARSPYVLAAYGGSDAGFEALEEELQVRLRALRGR